MMVGELIIELAKALGQYSGAFVEVHLVGADGFHRNVESVKYDYGSELTPPCIAVTMEKGGEE